MEKIKYEAKAKKIWQKAKDAIDFRRQKKDATWRELDLFDRGQQWDEKGNMPSWIPKPSSNYVNHVKKLKTGELLIDSYLGELKPLAPEQADNIFLLQKSYEQLWEKLNVRYFVQETIRTSRLLGTGILYVGWDENYIGGTRGHLYQGEILLTPIEPSKFFIDPQAFELEEALYCGTYTRTTVDHIKADASIEASAKKKFVENRKNNQYASEDQGTRGEIYGNRDYSSYQEDVVDLITYYEKEVNDEGGFSINVTYVADGIILKEVKGIKPNVFPFVILHQYKQRQDFWGISDCQLILPNVKMINKIQSIIGTIATLYQNPQKIVYEGAGIDPRIVSKYGNAYGLVYLSKHPDLSNVIRNVEVADIPMTLLNYIEFLKRDIQEFTGLTDIATGQGAGSLQTSTGVQSLIERSLVGNQDEYTSFERFLERLSYLLIHLAIEYYTDDRLMRMKSEDPNGDVEYEYIPFTAEFFKEIAWDFSIDITAKLKHTEQTNQEKIKMLSEWQLQYAPDISIVTPEDMIKAFNPANRDVILARIEQERQQKSMENAQQIAQQIMQTMEQIQVEQLQMEQMQRQAQPQPMEGGGMEPGAPLPPDAMVAQQRQVDPMQIITDIIFQALNPQKQGQGGIGDVQKRQQGLPPEGMPPGGMPM
jgi:hypothetical protein